MEDEREGRSGKHMVVERASKRCDRSVGLGILEFRIRILKDSNRKSQFISNSWDRNDNSNQLNFANEAA